MYAAEGPSKPRPAPGVRAGVIDCNAATGLDDVASSVKEVAAVFRQDALIASIDAATYHH